ncbi:MAG: sugar phosphate isomerase/epimerase [Candidatus Wildermuthbacteria bacterium]|nr:sugar phosphate isomerase/epimerase [Candidatus Wildermuthbacteria bacterium]
MAEEMQNSIGIMQGRVVPQTLERLQVFPERWEEEFRTAKELGFDHIELLDDKENRLRDLLKTQKQEVFASILRAGLQCTSLCADQLCKYSLLGNPVEFKERIRDLLQLIEGQAGFLVIMPFFDENQIHSAEELKQALAALTPFDELLQQKGLRFALEVLLPAKDIVGAFEEFSFGAIGMCYDIGNSIGNGFPVQEDIRSLGTLITHVHVKDKENGKNVRLGAHTKELIDAFEALKEIGYGGLLTLETCITPVPAEEAKTNLATVKKLMQGIPL